MSKDKWRVLVALLLVVTAALFASGTAIERSDSHDEESEAPAASASESGEAEEGEEREEAGEESEDSHAAEGEKSEEESETILGVDVESTLLIVLAVAASVALAAATVFIRRRWVLAVVAVFALAFAAGDLRELLHQLDESRGSVAAIAAVLLALHLLTCGLATVGFRREASRTRHVAS